MPSQEALINQRRVRLAEQKLKDGQNKADVFIHQLQRELELARAALRSALERDAHAVEAIRILEQAAARHPRTSAEYRRLMAHAEEQRRVLQFGVRPLF